MEETQQARQMEETQRAMSHKELSEKSEPELLEAGWEYQEYFLVSPPWSLRVIPQNCFQGTG